MLDNEFSLKAQILKALKNIESDNFDFSISFERLARGYRINHDISILYTHKTSQIVKKIKIKRYICLDNIVEDIVSLTLSNEERVLRNVNKEIKRAMSNKKKILK